MPVWVSNDQEGLYPWHRGSCPLDSYWMGRFYLEQIDSNIRFWKKVGGLTFFSDNYSCTFFCANTMVHMIWIFNILYNTERTGPGWQVPYGLPISSLPWWQLERLSTDESFIKYVKIPLSLEWQKETDILAIHCYVLPLKIRVYWIAIILRTSKVTYTINW